MLKLCRFFVLSRLLGVLWFLEQFGEAEESFWWGECSALFGLDGDNCCSPPLSLLRFSLGHDWSYSLNHPLCLLNWLSHRLSSISFTPAFFSLRSIQFTQNILNSILRLSHQSGPPPAVQDKGGKDTDPSWNTQIEWHEWTCAFKTCWTDVMLLWISWPEIKGASCCKGRKMNSNVPFPFPLWAADEVFLNCL